MLVQEGLTYRFFMHRMVPLERSDEDEALFALTEKSFGVVRKFPLSIQ